MTRRLLALFSVLGALALLALPGAAQAVTCPSGNSSGSSVIVPGGCFYNPIGGTIHGSVTVQSGGAFLAMDETITGSVVGQSGDQAVSLFDTSVTGSVSDSGGSNLVACNDGITGPVRASGVIQSVLIGDPDTGCSGNVIHGSLGVSGSTAVDIAANKITGPTSITNNDGSNDEADVEVSANTITGSLACSGNTPGVTNEKSPNTATGSKSGQCTGL